MNYPENEMDFRYGVYTRKSSEYEDSQVQSIQRQIDDLTELIDRNGLVVYNETLKESRSAFHPGREEFAKLVSWTQKGRVNAWICWHANRLSRNPIDAGTVVYLMDQGKLHHIRTRERIYYNTPSDKFMLQMEFTMSKKDSDDKSVLVRSGIARRNRRGYPTSNPPPGYILTGQGRSGHSSWVVDSERFKLVRQVFTKFLEGKDSLLSIHRFAKSIGLTTLPRKIEGGRPIARSAIHSTILKNPIYAGYFFGAEDRSYELDPALPRVVSREEFNLIQKMLRSRNPKTATANPAVASYRGFILDVEGNPLGVDRKYQMICDCRRKFAYLRRDRCPSCNQRIETVANPTYLSYTYYYSCRDRRSKERKAHVIEERKIDKFIIENVARRMEISRPVRDWAIQYLDWLSDQELRDRRREFKRREDMEAKFSLKRKKLRELYITTELSEEDYRNHMKDLEFEYRECEAIFEMRSDWLEDAKNVVNLAVELENVITHGSPKDKNQALSKIRSNLTWDGKNLSISNTKRVNGLIEALKNAKVQNPMLEPKNIVATQGSNDDFDSLRPSLSAYLDGSRT